MIESFITILGGAGAIVLVLALMAAIIAAIVIGYGLPILLALGAIATLIDKIRERINSKKKETSADEK